MLMSNVLFLAFSVVKISCWHYRDGGDKYWPERCLMGSNQSPINIITDDVVFDAEYTNDSLIISAKKQVNFTVSNYGHTIVFEASNINETEISLSGGPLKYEYVFNNIHFHWMSEHSIDNHKYPMEIHFVFRHSDLGNELLMDPNGLCVVAIFVTVTLEQYASSSLTPLIESILHVGNISSEIENQVHDIGKIFNEINVDDYFTYNGSLTTPGCDETVLWIVMKDTLKISDYQSVRLLRGIMLIDPFNFRPTQELNGRKVITSVQRNDSCEVCEQK